MIVVIVVQRGYAVTVCADNIKQIGENQMSKEDKQQHIDTIGGAGGYGGRNDERPFQNSSGGEKA